MGVQTYYFNESRKLWTGFDYLPITGDTIWHGDAQASTLRKVARIFVAFLLSIPAFLWDLVWTIRSRLFAVAPQAPGAIAAPIAEETRLQLVSNIKILDDNIGTKITDIVLSYVGPNSEKQFFLNSGRIALVRLFLRTEQSGIVNFADMQMLDTWKVSDPRLAFSNKETRALIFEDIQVPYPDEEVVRRIQDPQYASVSTVRLGPAPKMTARSASCVAKHFAERLRTLSITASDQDESLDSLGNDRSIQAITDHCPNIQSLGLGDCSASEATLWKLIDKLSKVQFFVCIKCNLSSRILERLAADKTLKMLSVNQVGALHALGIETVLANCPITNLQLVESHRNPILSFPNTLCTFLQRQGAHLRSFYYSPSIDHRENMTQIVEHLTQHCPILSEISLNHNLVSFDCLQNLIKARSGTLKNLTLAGFTTAKELLKLIPFFQTLQNFRYLESGGTVIIGEEITFATIFHMLKSCPTIQTLTLEPWHPDEKARLRAAFPHVTVS
jgi:hypothetical protein